MATTTDSRGVNLTTTVQPLSGGAPLTVTVKATLVVPATPPPPTP